MNTETKSRTQRAKNWMHTSTTFRMAIVGFLILVLLIPLSYTKNLIAERKQRQAEVVNEINESWGKEIQLYGPILKIPYIEYDESIVIDSKTKISQTIKNKTIAYAYFFPNKLQIDGTIDGELKKRGMYNTAVYTSDINIKGSFNTPDFSLLEIPEDDVQWNKAQIIMQTTNLKGIKEQLNIKFADKSFVFASNFGNNTSKEIQYDEYGMPILDEAYTIETKSFEAKNLFINNDIQFEIAHNASGSNNFQIIPIGKETTMHLTSNWMDANFMGEYLPYNPDKTNASGFDAYWKVLEMNRPFSQQYKNLPNLHEFAFGVGFFIPVDDYQQNERSAKYGYLMIALTFLLFFLIQTLSKIYIHPFQYLMIGLALVIFYTLLISISEHSNFTNAYLIAGIAVVGLITLYSKSIMKNWKFPIFIGLSLSVLYGFIFVIIQLESYALLVGSIGLFVILAAVMYASRKIDWS